MVDLWDPKNDLVGSLYFFENAEVQIPPRIVSRIPPQAEEYILMDFGVGPERTPLFARYELYSKSPGMVDSARIASSDLRFSRFVGWAALPMPTKLTESEVGIYTSLAEMDKEGVRERVASFFESTVSNLSIQARRGLRLMLGFMENGLGDKALVFSGGDSREVEK
jgi:hypothetical protein